jgi:cobaltochelatase CobS
MPPRGRPSAADVIAALAATGDVVVASSEDPAVAPPMPVLASLPSQIQRVAATALAPDDANALVELACSNGESFDPTKLAANSSGLDGHEVVLHPAFVRAAARQGMIFHFEPHGTVRRRKLESGKLKPKVVVKPGVTEPDFYFKPPWYDDLKDFVDRAEPVLLIGPAGCGKSEATERVFAERKQLLRIVSCQPRLTANDLEGNVDLVVQDGVQVTQFTPADPAIACAEGHGLLLDEADAAPSEAMYALYRALDGKDMRITRKGHDGTIPRHADFRVVGTQNTEGRGDDRGLHHGRAYQDDAFLDRWHNTIRVGYPPKEDEVLILRKRTGVNGSQAERIVDAALAFRNALRQDEIMFTCSMRRTLAVAGNLAVGMTPKRAWSFACVNRATPDDATKLKDTLHRIYGDKWSKT